MSEPADWMRRAIALSRGGFPAPNPHVGCVIVRDGEVLGEGFHHYTGGLHAEAEALAVAGDVRGADVFVTLEPCNHHGRQPPCAQALIDAGVARVFIASPDPNPKASGGAEHLRAAGIAVVEGLLRTEAEAANHQFHVAFTQGRPLVVGKAAMSLDGRIALPTGESKWITGEEARAKGHWLRAELGAVLVGRGTVEADDPHLTARIEGVVNPPTRIVLDPNNRLRGTERVFDDAAPTLHITGTIDLPQLVADLGSQGLTGVLVEGGPATLSRFVAANLLDRLELFVAPKLLGAGRPWLDAPLAATLDDVPSLEIIQTSSLGADIWITAAPRS